MKRRGRVLWAMMRTQVGTSALVHWEIGGKRVFLEKKLERSCALSKSNQSSASGGYLCYFDFLLGNQPQWKPAFQKLLARELGATPQVGLRTGEPSKGEPWQVERASSPSRRLSNKWRKSLQYSYSWWECHSHGNFLYWKFKSTLWISQMVSRYNTDKGAPGLWTEKHTVIFLCHLGCWLWTD